MGGLHDSVGSARFAVVNILGNPVQTLVQASSSAGTSALNEPFLGGRQVDQTEPFNQLRAGHGSWQVLLVGVHHDDSVFQLFVVGQSLERLCVLLDTVSVSTVHHVDEGLGSVEVVAPEGSELGLATDVPAIEFDVFVLEGLHVEADRGDRVDHLVELQLVENCSLARGVQAQHQHADFLVAEISRPCFEEVISHCCFVIYFVKLLF